LLLNINRDITIFAERGGKAMVNTNVIIAKAKALKEAQERVAELETELKMLVMDEGGKSDQHSGRVSDFDDEAPLTDKIVALLEGSSKRAFYFKEIFRRVNGNEASVRSTIAKLIKDGKIKRLAWGKYQAIQKDERPKADEL
jgi:hypothetical protein